MKKLFDTIFCMLFNYPGLKLCLLPRLFQPAFLLQKIFGDRRRAFALRLDAVVQPAHFFCADLPGQHVQRLHDARVRFGECCLHQRRALVVGEEGDVVLQHGEVVLAQLAVGGEGFEQVDVAAVQRGVAQCRFEADDVGEADAVPLQAEVAVLPVHEFQGKAGADAVLHAHQVGDALQAVRGGVGLRHGEGVGVFVGHRRQQAQAELFIEQARAQLIGLVLAQRAVVFAGRHLHQCFQHRAGKFGVDVDVAAFQGVEKEGRLAEVGLDLDA